jgi:predicted ATPase
MPTAARQIYVTDGDRQMTFESARALGERVREVYLDLGYAISSRFM